MNVTDNKMVDEFYQYINDMAYYCGVLDYIKSDKDRQVTFRNETTLYVNKLSLVLSAFKEKIYYYSRKQNLTVNEKNMLDKFSHFKFNQLNSLPKYHDGFEHEKEREEKFFTKYKRMNKEERKALTNQMTMVAMALHNY